MGRAVPYIEQVAIDFPELVACLRAHGAGKVLFGTNWPMIAPGKALEGLEDLALPEATRAAFLAGNAARVFRL